MNPTDQMFNEKLMQPLNTSQQIFFRHEFNNQLLEPKNMQNKQISRHKFTTEEDILLRSLVEKSGNTDWRAIAEQMPQRSPRQCRERWKNYLNPEVKNLPWKQEEDELLYNLYQKHGPKWSVIAKEFDSRTDINVKNRYVTRFAKIIAQKSQFQDQFQQSIDQDMNESNQFAAMALSGTNEDNK